MTQRRKPDYQTQPGLPAGKPNKIRQTESPGGGSVPLSGIGRIMKNGPPAHSVLAAVQAWVRGVAKWLGTHTPPENFHPPRPDPTLFWISTSRGLASRQVGVTSLHAETPNQTPETP